MKKVRISAVSLFCESIRPEVENTLSLVGIFPDNVRVPRPSDDQLAVLPTLSIYTRVRIDIDSAPFSDAEWRFFSPNGQLEVSHLFNAGFIEENAKSVREAGNEYATLIAQTKAAPFMISEIGRYVSLVRYDGEDYFAGAFRVDFAD